MSGLIRYAFIVWVLLSCAPRTLSAQETALGSRLQPPDFAAGPADPGQVRGQPAGPKPTPRHTGIKAMLKDLGDDVKHLPSKENLFWVGVGGGLALAAHPFDDNVNHSLVNSGVADDIFQPGEVLGELSTLLSVATATYAFGRIKDQPKVSHLGMALIQALAVREAMTQTI